MNTQRISLDISKVIDVPPVVRIGQGDNAGTTIVARIFDNGTSTSLDGMGARFCMRLPDGTHYVRDPDCTVSGNTITYVVDESHCAAVRGRTDEVYFDILASGSVIYSTSRFSVHVLRGVTDGSSPGESYDTAIDEAIRRANEAAEAAEEAAGGVTPLMSASTLGGAKLGDGLTLSGEALGVDQLSTSQIDSVANDGTVNSSKVLTGTRLTYLWGKIKAKFAASTHEHSASDITSGTLDVARIPNLSTDKLTSGTLPVARGGTGSITHISNAVLTGNGTGAVKNVSTKSGALYATAANGAAQFGTLPIAQGGTGATTAAGAVTNIVNGQAIAPSSVAATGEVTGKNGTTTHKLSDKANSAALAYVENATARTNHAVGDTFMFNGNFVQAAVAIAAGETITAAKVTQTTVSDKVLSIWNNAILYRGGVVADFNNYKQAGVYYYAGSSTDGVANKPNPSGGFTGILIVYTNRLVGTAPTIVLQMYFSSTLTAFFRVYGSISGWTAWKQIATV